MLIRFQIPRRLPEWARDIIKPGGTFEALTTYWFQMSTATVEMKRLKSGFLLKEILDRFKNKSLALDSKQLMTMYSGHETTLAGMLNSLGLFEVIWCIWKSKRKSLNDLFPFQSIPPYSSSIMFEMYKTSADYYYIKLFYRNTSVEDPKPLYIPKCGTKCNLTRFYYLYNDILPSHYDECLLANCANAALGTLHVFGILILFLYYVLVWKRVVILIKYCNSWFVLNRSRVDTVMMISI